jgi:hypothetical protein
MSDDPSDDSQQSRDFEKGDRVRHPEFGHGTVTEARPGKLVVSFDTGGEGSEMASTRRLEKVEQGEEGYVPWYDKSDKEEL